MSIVQSAYNRIRPYLPRAWETFNGVEVYSGRALDQTLSHPDYKQGLLDAIRDHVGGKTVELVGFGRGVTTVVALEAGASHVDVYEAATEMITLGVRTVVRNGVPLERVKFFHALVGEGVDVYGTADGASSVSPSTLGGRDVLILDCEGAERSILSTMNEMPPNRYRRDAPDPRDRS